MIPRKQNQERSKLIMLNLVEHRIVSMGNELCDKKRVPEWVRAEYISVN